MLTHPSWLARSVVPAAIIAAAVTLAMVIVFPGGDVSLSGRSVVGRSGTLEPAAAAGFNAAFPGNQLDTSKWATCYPWATGPGCTNATTKELEWYTPQGVTVSDGVLHLTARRRPVVEGGKAYSYTSGMVTTARSFRFTYGVVDIRARVPAGPGLWSALWLLPADEAWPPEIDMVEVLGGNPSHATVSYHSVAGRDEHRLVDTDNLSVGWHDFRIDWQPGSIQWFIDGHPCFDVRGKVPDQPMYLLMDLAVSGIQLPNASTTLPASLDVQSVRVQPD
jgi:beta-glucanase (GH16 family)